MALLAVFFAWPVGAMLARGVAPRALETLGSPRTWDLVATTLRMAAAGTLGSVILGIPGAYALYVCRFPGQRALRAVASVPFVLPTVVVGVAFRSLLGKDGAYSFLDLDGTETAVVAATVFFNFSVVVRTVGT
ncbi:MAG: iron ABC transporter permease, partial [Peptidiphaga gingivicola]